MMSIQGLMMAIVCGLILGACAGWAGAQDHGDLAQEIQASCNRRICKA